MNYFTSCDPHHDMSRRIWTYTLYILPINLAYILAFYLTYILTFFLAFYLTYILTFFLAFYLTYILTFYLTYILTFYLAYLLAFYLTYILAFFLAFYLACTQVEVRPVPTAIWKSLLKSGSAHCDLGLAVAVRQCPLGSGSRC